MPKKMKILHVFGSTTYGGAEKRTLDIIAYVDKSLYQFDICSLVNKKGTLDSHIQQLGCKIFYLSKKNPSFRKHFFDILRSEKYDVVHSHVYPFSGYILYLAHKAGVRKRIMHLRSSYEQQQSIYRRCFRWGMNHFIYKYATDILAVCNGAMDKVWSKYRDDRCKVIYNGIDLTLAHQANNTDIRQQFAIPEKDYLITHIGSMVPVKNHEMIVRVFYEIQLQKPNAYLLLIGRRNEGIEHRIIELCKDLKIHEKVIIAGVHQNIFPFLQTSDLFLFPSFFEGLPGAVLEACAVSLPVLASDIPGVKEISHHCNNVYSLSLAEPTKKWAQRSLDIMQKKHDINLQDTPFCLQKNIAAILDVYQGEK
ncbi:glycosyltransferase [Candidatus Uabimicrobium amorphum]|uniref:Glycosyl transferase family 1 n=1 Tax=Uabimicrobium amorphum TaxID=2596890 RepID=A0A5S9IHH7_UABAM|nr:glycosyltransferase [Candidatus Uabimicrobium amorphum]BBM81687.1 glycosyl transferase family 1 [Candidatus Uabimicrobium amorphum]